MEENARKEDFEARARAMGEFDADSGRMAKEMAMHLLRKVFLDLVKEGHVEFPPGGEESAYNVCALGAKMMAEYVAERALKIVRVMVDERIMADVYKIYLEETGARQRDN